jgi:hypothetical protein
MTLNLVPSQLAKLVKVCADSPRNTTRLLTRIRIIKGTIKKLMIDVKKKFPQATIKIHRSY